MPRNVTTPETTGSIYGNSGSGWSSKQMIGMTAEGKREYEKE